MSSILSLLEPEQKLQSKTATEIKQVPQSSETVQWVIVDSHKLSETVNTILMEYNISLTQALIEIEKMQGAASGKLRENVLALADGYGKIEAVLTQVAALLSKKSENADLEREVLLKLRDELNR